MGSAYENARFWLREHGIRQSIWDYVCTFKLICKQNWLRRGATNVDALCYTALPTSAPESVRLADDDGDNMPQDDLE